MKKVLSLILLSLISLLIIVSIGWGANTITESTPVFDTNNRIKIVTITWIDDATDGIADYQLTKSYYDGWIIAIDTNPGGTAPDDNYDVYLKNSDGIDILMGSLENRDTINSERVEGLAYYNKGKPTFTISGQTINNATGTITLYIWVERI